MHLLVSRGGIVEEVFGDINLLRVFHQSLGEIVLDLSLFERLSKYDCLAL